MAPPKRRAVITGIGIVAPNGNDLASFWSNLCSGNSAAAFVNRIDTSGLPGKVACLLRHFNPREYLSPAAANSLPPAIQYGVAAAGLAVKDAAIDLHGVDPDRIAIVGANSPGTGDPLRFNEDLFPNANGSHDKLSVLINAQAGGSGTAVAVELGIQGHSWNFSTSASTGADTLGHALALVRDDDADIAIAGAAEAPITPGYWGIFCASNQMSREADKPGRAMKPFSRERDGFILGEGAAFLIVEELTFALKRGATIYAEILGYARHFNSPGCGETNGSSGFGSLEKALRRANLHPGELNYLNAHGTATPHGDSAETRALKAVFGSDARTVQISATKPVTGHWVGAAGPLEAAICALAIRNGELPPTINLTAPDPDCDLDYVPIQSRRFPVTTAASLNAGFDGSNTCLVLGNPSAL